MNPIKVAIQTIKILTIFIIALTGVIVILSYFGVEQITVIKTKIISFIELAFYDNSISSILFAFILIFPFIITIINIFIPDINSNKYLSIEDSSGYIHISIRAISDYIKQIAIEYSEIESARPKLFYKDGNIEILLYLEVTSKQNIIGLSEILKSDICDSLTKTTAIRNDNIGKIEIVIDNIKLDKDLKTDEISKIRRKK